MTTTEADLAKLTHRQREVMTALARQLSNDKVARLLDIAEATLKIDMTAFRMCFRHWRLPGPPVAILVGREHLYCDLLISYLQRVAPELTVIEAASVQQIETENLPSEKVVLLLDIG